MTIEVSPADPPQAVDDTCSFFERMSIVLGGGALGAGLGFVVVMTAGRLDSLSAATYLAPVYLFALYLAYGAFRDTAELGRWRSILPGLELAALAAWPAFVLLASDKVRAMWAVAVLVLMALAVLAGSARSPSVFRSSWLLLAATVLSAQAAMQSLMAS